MLIAYLVALLISFYLLTRVTDEYFIKSLDIISKKLKMASDVAGATLMAVGSSAPELFISIIALVMPGNHENVGMGTIVGSALFNILVIIGISAVVRRAELNWEVVVRDTLFYAISIIVLLIAFYNGEITILESGIFIGLYVVYVICVIKWKDWFKYEEILPEDTVLTQRMSKEDHYEGWKVVFWPFDKFLSLFFIINNYVTTFILSIIIIAGLSWVLVESAVKIAEILSIPSSIVALTILAVGTSIPDLISSMIVAKQGRGGMAISNAIGSNVFDVLFGLGVPWMIMLIATGDKIIVSTENLYSSIILLFATVVVIFFLLWMNKWKIRRGGYVLIALYILYLGWAISQVVF